MKDKLRIKFSFLKKFDTEVTTTVVTCLKKIVNIYNSAQMLWGSPKAHEKQKIQISRWNNIDFKVSLLVAVGHGTTESEFACLFGSHDLSFRSNEYLKLSILFPIFLHILKVRWRLFTCWFYWQSFTFLSRGMTLVLCSQLENIEINVKWILTLVELFNQFRE